MIEELINLLLKVDYANKGGKFSKIRSENYKYLDTNKERIITGISISSTRPRVPHTDDWETQVAEEMAGATIRDLYLNLLSNILFEDCIANQNTHLLSEKVITEETSTGLITNIEKYTYNNETLFLRSIEKINSDKSSLTENYTYPSDYPANQTYNRMKSLNILNPIVSKKMNRNGSSQKITTNYKEWGKDIFTPETIILQTNEGKEEMRMRYHSYDSYGNPTDVSRDDVDRTIYLWSYNGQYPIAEIKNATYDQVKTALGIDPASISSTSLPNMALVDGLRSKLPNAHITTYTYKPLVGMLSATDPSGLTTYYDYDNFGRLKETYIMDNGKKVIQMHDYKYRNQ